MSKPIAFVAGTFDTKAAELTYMAEHIAACGVPVSTIDLSTSKKSSNTDVSAAEIAACHPDGESAVFTGDRGTAVAGMSRAFEQWVILNLSLIHI